MGGMSSYKAFTTHWPLIISFNAPPSDHTKHCCLLWNLRQQCLLHLKNSTNTLDKRSEALHASANMHTSETRVATKDILGSVAAVDPTHTDPHTETSSPLRSIPSQDREGVTH